MGKKKIVDILKQINVCALFLLEARNNLRNRVKFANWCLWKRGSGTGLQIGQSPYPHKNATVPYKVLMKYIYHKKIITMGGRNPI